MTHAEECTCDEKSNLSLEKIEELFCNISEKSSKSDYVMAVMSKEQVKKAIEIGLKPELIRDSYTSAMSPVTQLACDLTDPIFKERFVGNIIKK